MYRVSLLSAEIKQLFPVWEANSGNRQPRRGVAPSLFMEAHNEMVDNE